MPEHAEHNKYALSVAGVSDKTLEKEVRKRTKTDSDSLIKKRNELEKDSYAVERFVQMLQELHKKKCETPEEVAKTEREINQIFTLANMISLHGLYKGFGLLADLLSVKLSWKDKESGERMSELRSSAEMTFDMDGYLEELLAMTHRQNQMLKAMGQKQDAFWQGKFDSEDDAKHEETPETTQEPEMPVGVPDKELEAKPTDAEIQKKLRGE